MSINTGRRPKGYYDESIEIWSYVKGPGNSLELRADNREYLGDEEDDDAEEDYSKVVRWEVYLSWTNFGKDNDKTRIEKKENWDTLEQATKYAELLAELYGLSRHAIEIDGY